MIPTPETKIYNEWSDEAKKSKAFIVLGLEGSGTYMMHNALVESGCYVLEVPNKPIKIPKIGNWYSIALRLSFPHAGRWPKWRGIIRKCQDAGYEVIVIWIVREPYAQLYSIVRRDEDRLWFELLRHQQDFFMDMGSMVDFGSNPPDWLVITYEAFVHSEGFRRWLFEERLGLLYPEDFEVLNDRNEQYY